MKNHPAVLGAFLISGLLLLTAGLFLVGNRHQAFAHHIVLYSDFGDVNGLAPGSKVRVDGLDAGQLDDIELPQKPSGKFRLKLTVVSKVNPMVRKDSWVTVESDGLVGDKFLLIHNGTDNSPEVTSGATLNSKEPVELSDIMTKVTGIADQANATIGDLRNRMNGVLTGVQATVANTDGLVSDARHGKGTVGMLLNDPQTAGQIRQVVANAQQASANLSQATQQASQMVADIQSRNLPQKLDRSMDSVQDATQQIDRASQSVNAALSDALAPGPSGTSAAENIRDSLANVNLATANLADDTEAIKHEFFFRGFFKKRGFYSLQELTPAQYCSNTFFHNPANERFWIGASGIFVQGANGREYLSPQGQQEIDRIVGGIGASILNRPLVIEGYSTDPQSADRLVLSRTHALLIAQYLEQHFYLDSSNVGVMVLEDKPPASSGKTSWDGACIVLLNDKK